MIADMYTDMNQLVLYDCKSYSSTHRAASYTFFLDSLQF